MNAFNLFKLFSFLVLTVVFASQKLNKNARTVIMFHLMRSGSVAIEEVRDVFENADEDFDNDYDGAEYLVGCKSPEVVKYVLSKSLNSPPGERVRAIEKILSGTLVRGRKGVIKLLQEN